MPLFAELLERNKAPNLSTAHRALLEQRVERVDHIILDKDTHIGIEIEVEGIHVGITEFAHLWEAKGDNSLREGGVEYISPPIKGDEISRMISLFYNYLPTSAIFSQRTSIHVHVNCLDLTPEQISRFVILYLLFEKSLYRFIGRNRERNIFCVPLQDTWRVGSLFQDLQKKLKDPLNHVIEREEHRYMGLNLHALHEFGTLEFRQLHGTRDQQKLINWINLLLLLRKKATEIETKDLIERILLLNTNSQYRVFLMDVFGPLTPLFNQKFVDEDIAKGVFAVKYSILMDKFKTKLLKEASTQGPAYLWQMKSYGSLREPQISWDVAVEEEPHNTGAALTFWDDGSRADQMIITPAMREVASQLLRLQAPARPVILNREEEQLQQLQQTAARQVRRNR